MHEALEFNSHASSARSAGTFQQNQELGHRQSIEPMKTHPIVQHSKGDDQWLTAIHLKLQLQSPIAMAQKGNRWAERWNWFMSVTARAI